MVIDQRVAHDLKDPPPGRFGLFEGVKFAVDLQKCLMGEILSQCPVGYTPRKKAQNLIAIGAIKRLNIRHTAPFQTKDEVRFKRMHHLSTFKPYAAMLRPLDRR